MNLFEMLILNLILILFPIFTYLLYEVYQSTVDKKKNDLILYFCLITSFYLLFRFGHLQYLGLPFLILDIPLIIAYINNKKISICTLSVLLIIYYYFNLRVNIIIFIIEYIIYYFIYKYRRNSSQGLIFIYSIFKVILFIIYIVISPAYNINNINDINILVILSLCFIIIVNLLAYLFNIVESILSLHRSVKDIEEEKQIRDSLFKITHEIKNPIAVCKGYLDMFDIDNIEHAKKYVPILKGEIEQVLVLLQDFLYITKININKDMMDLGILIDDLKKSLKIVFKEHDIEFICDEIEELYIDADYNRLKQVLINLLKNSMESIGEKGKITLSTNIVNNSLKINIIDNGAGMSEEELKNIKEAFFTTKKNGTGLGVYLSNEIIKSHGGNIKYSSKLGCGTKVVITLPINEKGY